VAHGIPYGPSKGGTSHLPGAALRSACSETAEIRVSLVSALASLKDEASDVELALESTWTKLLGLYSSSCKT